MQRRNFLLSSLLAAPVTLFASLRGKKGIKVDAGQDRFNAPLKNGGLQMTLKVSAEDTDGDLTIFESIFTSGGPPLHVHPDQDEIFCVMEGEFHFQIGNENFQAKAGDTLFAPRGVPHAFLKTGDVPARMLLTYQPAGKMEAFFKTVASLPQMPPPDELAKIFEEHGMKIVGARLTK